MLLYSFSLLHNGPSDGHTTIYVSILLIMDTGLFPTFGYYYYSHHYKHICTCLLKSISVSCLGTNLGSELLGLSERFGLADIDTQPGDFSSWESREIKSASHTDSSTGARHREHHQGCKVMLYTCATLRSTELPPPSRPSVSHAILVVLLKSLSVLPYGAIKCCWQTALWHTYIWYLVVEITIAVILYFLCWNLTSTNIKESQTGKAFPALGTEKETGLQRAQFCQNVPKDSWYSYAQIRSKDNPSFHVRKRKGISFYRTKQWRVKGKFLLDQERVG